MILDKNKITFIILRFSGLPALSYTCMCDTFYLHKYEYNCLKLHDSIADERVQQNFQKKKKENK